MLFLDFPATSLGQQRDLFPFFSLSRVRMNRAIFEMHRRDGNDASMTCAAITRHQNDTHENAIVFPPCRNGRLACDGCMDVWMNEWMDGRQWRSGCRFLFLRNNGDDGKDNSDRSGPSLHMMHKDQVAVDTQTDTPSHTQRSVHVLSIVVVLITD